MLSAWTAARTSLLLQAVGNGVSPAGPLALLAPGLNLIVGVVDVVGILWISWIYEAGLSSLAAAALAAQSATRERCFPARPPRKALAPHRRASGARASVIRGRRAAMAGRGGYATPSGARPCACVGRERDA
jgi:hypothetical protein